LNSRKKTLKNKLSETFRELKTWTLNEEGSEAVALENEKLLTCLKSMDDHAMHNV
jgi:hypothetical protein